MKFKLEVTMGNDAMRFNQDLVGALRDVADRIEKNAYPMNEDLSRGIVDDNGNAVGFWYLTGEDAGQ